MCSYQPKWGDFHIGRACRLLATEAYGGCLNDEDDHTSSSSQLFISWVSLPPLTPAMEQFLQRIREKSQTAYARLSRKSDALYEAIQDQVCQAVETRCGVPFPNYAWQERVFCKGMITDCDQNEKQTKDPASSDYAKGIPPHF
jgi:hypothetical protein